MTEARWLAFSGKPTEMVQVLGDCSERKQQLFVVALCRLVKGHMKKKGNAEAVDVAERHADGQASSAEWLAARHASPMGPPPDADAAVYNLFGWDGRMGRGIYWVRHWLGGLVPDAVQVALLRDIFGSNPAQPVVACLDQSFFKKAPPRTPHVLDLRDVLRWNSGMIGKMASYIYDTRRWGDLPVLADYLEDAGYDEARGERVCRGCNGSCATQATDGTWHACQWCKPLGSGMCPLDVGLLDHLRGREVCRKCAGVVTVWAGKQPNPANCWECRGTGRCPCDTHTRGCWALDLLLGKS
jgi:hypothetical protein